MPELVNGPERGIHALDLEAYWVYPQQWADQHDVGLVWASAARHMIATLWAGLGYRRGIFFFEVFLKRDFFFFEVNVIEECHVRHFSWSCLILVDRNS